MLRSFLISSFVLALVAHFLLPMPAPTSAAATLPVAGQFTALTYTKPLDLHKDRGDYQPPEDFPEPYQFSMYGQAAPRLWHGLGAKIGVPRPTLILLHGSQRTGASMVDMWSDTARRHNLILIAPNSAAPEGWNHQADGAAFLDALLKEASKTYPIDMENIYIMGHSAGGIFAQQLANRQTGPWKAVVTHGAAMNTDDIRPAQTPVPIFAFIGDQDHLFPLPNTTEVSQALSQAGHDVTLVQISNHDHWYYKIAPQIAADMWAYLKETG